MKQALAPESSRTEHGIVLLRMPEAEIGDFFPRSLNVVEEA